MMDLISGSLSIFSGASSAAKGIRDSIRKLSGEVDQEMRNNLNIQIGDLIDSMHEMREQHAALLNRLSELEAENRKLTEFEIDRENYVLKEISPNAFVYTNKFDGQTEEGKPYLCAHCFDRKVKSILQFESHAAYTDILKCNECGGAIHKAANRAASVVVAPVRRRGIFE